MQDTRKYSDKQRETDGGTVEASAGCQEVSRHRETDGGTVEASAGCQEVSRHRETDGGTVEASAGCQEVFRQTKRNRWWHSRGQCRISGSIPTNKEKQMVAQQRPV